MNLFKTNQIDIQELKKKDFDVIIVASGYESRAKYLTHTFKFNASKKICFGFTEHTENFERKTNDLVFKSQKFEYHLTSGNENRIITNVISEILSKESKEIINILI